jgi:4'-phosphopantetheinyl transferase
MRTLAAILSPDERQRAKRYRFQVDSERHIVGRALLRIILGRILHTKPENLFFRHNEFGKPLLLDALNKHSLQFNVSHSGDLILVALAAGRQIGVDVERVRDDMEPEAMARRFFSSREKADIAALPARQRRDAFFRCWTRKEAFIKAKGEGLSLPLDQFDVSVNPAQPAILLATRPDPVEASRWVIQDLKVAAGHTASVAVEGTGWRLKSLKLAIRKESSAHPEITTPSEPSR